LSVKIHRAVDVTDVDGDVCPAFAHVSSKFQVPGSKFEVRCDNLEP
jgi:hypothetical protein